MGFTLSITTASFRSNHFVSHPDMKPLYAFDMHVIHHCSGALAWMTLVIGCEFSENCGCGSCFGCGIFKNHGRGSNAVLTINFLLHVWKKNSKLWWHNYNSNFKIGKMNFFLNKNVLKYTQLLKKITAVAVVVLTTASRLQLSNKHAVNSGCSCGYSIHQ